MQNDKDKLYSIRAWRETLGMDGMSRADIERIDWLIAQTANLEKLARITNLYKKWKDTQWNGTESAQFKATIARSYLEEIGDVTKDTKDKP